MEWQDAGFVPPVKEDKEKEAVRMIILIFKERTEITPLCYRLTARKCFPTLVKSRLKGTVLHVF